MKVSRHESHHTPFLHVFYINTLLKQATQESLASLAPTALDVKDQVKNFTFELLKLRFQTKNQFYGSTCAREN